jgi:hypothetical protein
MEYSSAPVRASANLDYVGRDDDCRENRWIDALHAPDCAAHCANLLSAQPFIELSRAAHVLFTLPTPLIL